MTGHPDPRAPLGAAELDAIQARVDAGYRDDHWFSYPWKAVQDDVPALLAEARRLRAEVARLTEERDAWIGRAERGQERAQRSLDERDALRAETERLRRRTHEIQAEESRRSAGWQRQRDDARRSAEGWQAVCHQWYAKSTDWALERDRLRTALTDLIAQVEAAEHTSMWAEVKLSVKRARAALAGDGGPDADRGAVEEDR